MMGADADVFRHLSVERATERVSPHQSLGAAILWQAIVDASSEASARIRDEANGWIMEWSSKPMGSAWLASMFGVYNRALIVSMVEQRRAKVQQRAAFQESLYVAALFLARSGVLSSKLLRELSPATGKQAHGLVRHSSSRGWIEQVGQEGRVKLFGITEAGQQRYDELGGFSVAAVDGMSAAEAVRQLFNDE